MDEEPVAAFRTAGRTLLSLGLVRGSEGNLSTFDGTTLLITRTGAELGALGGADLIAGTLHGDIPGASTDLAIHRRYYLERGPGAVAHAHPAGSVAEDRAPGAHGAYAFGTTLARAVDEIFRSARGAADPEDAA